MSTKRIQIVGNLDAGVKMVTLRIGDETKTLRILGDGNIWGVNVFPEFTFDQTALQLDVNGAGTHKVYSNYILNDDELKFTFK